MAITKFSLSGTNEQKLDDVKIDLLRKERKVERKSGFQT